MCGFPAIDPSPETGICSGRPCHRVAVTLAAQGFSQGDPNWDSGLKFYRSVLRLRHAKRVQN